MSRRIGVHRVLRPTGAVGRLDATGARHLTPLVGRDHELARLKAAWHLVERGQGTIVHVIGEAGIGKSRLVRALIDELGPRIGAERILQCSAHHQGTALYPAIRFLEHSHGLDRTQAGEHQLRLLERTAADVGLHPAEAVPLLADLLAVRGAYAGAGPSLTPRGARAATLRILGSLLVANPAPEPLLLVVEDLHWADPTTVDLLVRITARLGEELPRSMRPDVPTRVRTAMEAAGARPRHRARTADLRAGPSDGDGSKRRRDRSRDGRLGGFRCRRGSAVRRGAVEDARAGRRLGHERTRPAADYGAAYPRRSPH